MGDLNAVEIKAFVPARDFALSKDFYEDLGFTVAWSGYQACIFALRRV
jgi:predicted lactoylglutathione lyase